jgi:heptosyltransferase-2
MPNWLGDAVMCTPALDDLRRRAGDQSLVLVAPPGIADLFRHDPRVDDVIPDAARSRVVRLSSLRALGRSLRERYGQFDVAFSLKNSFSARFLLYAAGAARRVGKPSGWSDVLLTDVIPCEDQQHQVEAYSRIVRGFFADQHEPGPLSLHVPVRRKFSRATIGISPGTAQGGSKSWGVEKFAQTARLLCRDFDLALIGSRKEQALGEQIEAVLRQSGIENYQNLIGRTNISQLLSVIAGLDLFIGNDSGPMHVATALGVPTVAIFGPTHPYRAYPWRHEHCEVLYKDVPCAPCWRRTCPLKHHECMKRIEIQEVVDAAFSLLDRTPLAHAG